MATEAKILVRSTVLPTAYVAILFAAIKAHFNNINIRNAKMVSFERNKPGRVHIFIYWFKFQYK